jgi:hypothetical protein
MPKEMSPLVGRGCSASDRTNRQGDKHPTSGGLAAQEPRHKKKRLATAPSSMTVLDIHITMELF